MTPRLTQQEIDPLGAISAWPLTIAAALIASGLALAATLGHGDQLRSVPLAVFAVIFAVLAGIALVVFAHESMAPFTVERLWIVVALGALAAIAEFASTAGSNHYVSDDFGGLVLGVLLLGAAPYRDWISIVIASSAAALVMAGIAVATSEHAVISVPAILYAVIGMLPVLALGAASAGYSGRVTSEIVGWQRVAARDLLATDALVRDGIARSVERKQLLVLGRDVLPFLDAVLDRGQIDASDRREAARLARELRGVLVARSDATWLSSLVDPSAQTAVDVELIDSDGRAARIEPEQRSALTALITRLLPMCRSIRVTVAAAEVDGVDRVVLEGRLRSVSTPSARRDLQPFVAVCRTAFVAHDVSISRGTVRAEFDFEV